MSWVLASFPWMSRSDRDSCWSSDPVQSWVNLRYRKSQQDVKFFEKLLRQCNQAWADGLPSGSVLQFASHCQVTGAVIVMLALRGRVARFSKPISGCGAGRERHRGGFLSLQGRAGELDPITVVCSPSSAAAAHVTRQILARLDACRLDGFFPCHCWTCPLALEGFFWRIRHQHGAAQVLVVALPERLEQKNQSEFEREVVNCSEALRQSGKRLVVVMADEGSQLFHRLAHLRKTDLELEAKALEYEELQRCCPFLDEASLIRGEPLSGKPREILGVQNRIALWSGLSELEFCRLCRNICREGQAPQLLIDFGWTDLDGKQSWAWQHNILKFELVLKLVRKWSFCVQGHEKIPEPQILGALRSDLQFARLPSSFKEHPYTYTERSLEEMVWILEHLVAWRTQVSCVAPVIMPLGDTGTGKTYLLTKTFELYGRCNAETLDIRVLSLSQAINPYRLMEWVRELLKSAAPSTLTVVILDEVNATDAVEFCKRRCTVSSRAPKACCSLCHQMSSLLRREIRQRVVVPVVMFLIYHLRWKSWHVLFGA
ncbi:unnamed protein product [Symbiodinium natans]|uniref:Uncharacterized protein n=1 Tax=Symbiodinium natans TaxID=878477 RepID=A0A812K6A0_9DINO|nr:unnamed protein product [Symbiodinium natans]